MMKLYTLFIVAMATIRCFSQPIENVQVFDEGNQPITIQLRRPRNDNVTHVTSSNQYQKLFPSNGKYKFGYHTPDQFRVEERSGDGTLKGTYAYKDSNGTITAYSYSFDGVRYKQEPLSDDFLIDEFALPETGLPVNTNKLEALFAN